MPQILHTKDFGPIEVVRSYVKGNLHIVELANGGYAHSSGLPVQNKNELMEAIPPGPALDKALEWWEHRDDEPEEPKRSIVIRPDGTLAFDDGSPVQSISDIIQHIPPGPFLDAAITAFSHMKKQAEEAEKSAATPAGQAAKAVLRKAIKDKPEKAAKPKDKKPDSSSPDNTTSETPAISPSPEASI